VPLIRGRTPPSRGPDELDTRAFLDSVTSRSGPWSGGTKSGIADNLRRYDRHPANPDRHLPLNARCIQAPRSRYPRVGRSRRAAGVRPWPAHNETRARPRRSGPGAELPTCAVHGTPAAGRRVERPPPSVGCRNRSVTRSDCMGGGIAATGWDVKIFRRCAPGRLVGPCDDRTPTPRARQPPVADAACLTPRFSIEALACGFDRRGSHPVTLRFVLGRRRNKQKMYVASVARISVRVADRSAALDDHPPQIFSSRASFPSESAVRDMAGEGGQVGTGWGNPFPHRLCPGRDFSSIGPRTPRPHRAAAGPRSRHNPGTAIGARSLWRRPPPGTL